MYFRFVKGTVHVIPISSPRLRNQVCSKETRFFKRETRFLNLQICMLAMGKVHRVLKGCQSRSVA